MIFEDEPIIATTDHPIAWYSVHIPSPIIKLEIIVTNTANATPLRAPNCAPIIRAATVTGWIFGRGVITTLSNETLVINVTKVRILLAFFMSGDANIQNASDSKITSITNPVTGPSTGPWMPYDWNMTMPRG